ncbi:MAG: selenocysteine-specific translation elongation factor [Streptococcaceae bacterium]|jgi:selenocysteine-specific elongation factor|nr:selenocysteine-specific translation elongation factor [Streptococcaceae bacterium]
MTNIVIGTAGHIDHGKTTLIKALSGIETDTTKEEKKRGMSINLGFAYMKLPNGLNVGLVDVPGHEKFIKNMVAGLPGVNMILLVIDAAEGIMPQTKEHMDILTLLGVENFIIVLSKADTVDADLKELVIEDIKEQLQETKLKDAPIIETDSVTGTGIEELKMKIQEFATTLPERKNSGQPRLNIDRIFSVKGFGTVVTGTLLDGTIKLGDELYLYPGKKKVRVRNIQVHEKDVEQATSGQRTALNLANVKSEEIERGYVLSAGENLESTWMIDVKVTSLPENITGIGLWDRVRFLIGTREVMARTVPIGQELINAGEEGFLQLRLEEEVLVKEKDRFILRSYSPMYTIAGGEVLDAQASKHKRFQEQVMESLKAKEAGSLDELVLDFLFNKKTPFAKPKELSEYLGNSIEEINEIIAVLVEENKLFETTNGLLEQKRFGKLAQVSTEILQAYHKKYRLRSGIPIEEYRSQMRTTFSSDKEIASFIELLLRNNQVNEVNKTLATSDFEVKMNKYQLDAKNKIEMTLRKNGFMPVVKEELYSLEKNAEEVLEALANQSVMFLNHEEVISMENYQKAIDLTKNFIKENGKMTLGEFRDISNSSRRASMLILESLDKEGYTKRVENYRVLGEKLND